jgi:hypothetical protein
MIAGRAEGIAGTEAETGAAIVVEIEAEADVAADLDADGAEATGRR